MIGPQRDLPERSEWNAIYTRHQHEKVISDILARNGIEVFLPTYTVIRQWSDRIKRLSLPLFPCYVFLRSCFDQRWEIAGTPGIYSFVMFSGRPAAIPDAEIDAIRKAVESRLWVEPHPFLHYGDLVRVRSGPLKSIEGILVRKKGSCRLVLSLQLIGKSMAVEVDAFSVELLRHGAAPSFVSSIQKDVSANYQGGRRIDQKSS